MNGRSGSGVLVLLTVVILVPLGFIGAIGHAGVVVGGIGIALLLVAGIVAVISAMAIRDGRM